VNQRQMDIAHGNRAFLDTVVGLHLCRKDFQTALFASFDQPAQYAVEPLGDYSGYVLIDATDVKLNCSHGGFADDVRSVRVLGHVALKIAIGITGDLNDKASVTEGPYRFDFAITRYERDGEHGFEMVDDPVPLPSREKLGRFVELKVTIPMK
jgi:hypothetical protein